MRIATWNINGLRARLPYLVHWLRARKPDVVGLQELKLTDDQFPHDELRAEGYHAVMHGQKGWNGVAVLSRAEARVTLAGLPGQEEAGARLLTAEVQGLSFTTVYVPNGKSIEHEDFPMKLAWLDRLIEHIGETVTPDGSSVLCGDFNLCPAAIDSWNESMLAGSIFHTDAERERFRRLLGTGLCDLLREKRPDDQVFSWYDYRGGAFHRKQGLRIDLLLATRPVLTRTRSVEIDRDYRKKQDGLTPSDHVPVLVDLE